MTMKKIHNKSRKQAIGHHISKMKAIFISACIISFIYLKPILHSCNLCYRQSHILDLNQYLCSKSKTIYYVLQFSLSLTKKLFLFVQKMTIFKVLANQDRAVQTASPKEFKSRRWRRNGPTNLWSQHVSLFFDYSI